MGEAAGAQKIELAVMMLPEARRDFVLMPQRWVIERSFAWAARCVACTLVFVMLMLALWVAKASRIT